MAQIKFVRGVKANYQPADTHLDAIFFATDTHELLVNGEVYGLGRAVSDITYDQTTGNFNLTFVGNVDEESNPQNVTINIPAATGTNPGLMSAEDKAKFDELVGEGSGSVADQIQEAITQLTNTINDYSVNGKTFGDNDGAIVVNGADIKLDGYSATATSPVVLATDTVNAAIAKVEKANEDTQSALDTFIATKGVANGLASLDENGKIPVSQLNGQLAHVFGIDHVVESSSALPGEGVEAGDLCYALDNHMIYNYNGTSWDEPMAPAEDTIYNFRNSDATGDTSRTNILYRWDGTTMVEISASLALGETAGTAYEGNKGAANKAALNSIPSTVVTGFGAVTPAADSVAIAVTDSDKTAETNLFTSGDGTTITLPAATASAAGVMTAADKTYIEEVKTALGGDASALEDVLHKSNAGIGVLAGYSVAAEQAAIAPTDTINQAIGKLEKTLNDLTGEGGEGSISDQIDAALDDMADGVAYNSEDHTLSIPKSDGTTADVVLDTYVGENAISVSAAVSNSKTVSLVIDPASEGTFLTQSAAGLKVDGIGAAITNALTWEEV